MTQLASFCFLLPPSAPHRLILEDHTIRFSDYPIPLGYNLAWHDRERLIARPAAVSFEDPRIASSILAGAGRFPQAKPHATSADQRLCFPNHLPSQCSVPHRLPSSPVRRLTALRPLALRSPSRAKSGTLTNTRVYFKASSRNQLRSYEEGVVSSPNGLSYGRPTHYASNVARLLRVIPN